MRASAPVGSASVTSNVSLSSSAASSVVCTGGSATPGSGSRKPAEPPEPAAARSMNRTVAVVPAAIGA